MLTTLSHPYRPKPWTMTMASAFFGAIAFFMGREAMFNDRGLVINGLIHLGPSGATIFYWCIAAIGGAFVAVGVPAVFIGLFAPSFGFSRGAVVRFADIQHLQTQLVQKQRFLNVFHTDGMLAINESFLPSRAAFDELCAAIAAHVPGSAQRTT